MAKKPKKPTYVLTRDEIVERETGPHLHPWNPNSGLYGVRLADAAGLKRTGVSLARLPPEKESFAYHAHRLEEEWVYVLAGEGVAVIDGEERAIAAGDFLGFPTDPPVAHLLRNPGPEDLVYLMGGERRKADVVDFPELGRIAVRTGDKLETFAAADAAPMAPPPGGKKGKKKRA